MAKDNTGATWGNKEKKTDKHPDFTGSAMVNGVDYWVSMWKRGKDAKEGSPALRFTFQPKQAKEESNADQKKSNPPFDDDSIPF